MRAKSLGWVGVVMALGGVACGSDNVALQPDGPGRGARDGGKGSTGDATASSVGSATAGNTAKDAGGRDADVGPGPDIAGGKATDALCDMNGIWIGRQVTLSEAFGTGQFANNWYYLEITQTGDSVRVAKHFDCGIKVHGVVDVVLSRATADALRVHNLQTGRQGTFTRKGNECELRFDRFWSVRGANEARFVPIPRNVTESISSIAKTRPLPSRAAPEGAEDWEGDGKLGSAWQVSGVVRGPRNTIQRDWTEWFTAAGYTITPTLDFAASFVVRAMFDAEEQLFDPDKGPLASSSTVNGRARHTMTFQFLGRNKSDARFKRLVKPDDFETCLAIQAALPSQKEL